MKIIYGINRIKKYPKPVVALGVFDGLHLGHRQILKSAVKKAKGLGGTSIVLTFWPHPQKEKSLYSLEHRLKLMGALGIQVCIIINFDRKFASITAADFIENILVKKIGAEHIYIGKNFKFGKNAQGDFHSLGNASRKHHFGVKVFGVVKIHGKTVSSTYIRDLIKKGKLKDAQKLLARPVSILGAVIKGISLGRKLGYPTANIDPHHEIVPPEGVYAVKIILDGKSFLGACYIGPKPVYLLKSSAQQSEASPKGARTGEHKSTRAQEHKRTGNIEVHIFNFKKNIYGKTIEIQFIKKIRNPRKYSSLSALSFQIKKDISSLQKDFPHP